MASPLCDTPTGRSDVDGRASCRVLCMHATVSCGNWSAKLLDNRQKKCSQKLLENRLESALNKSGKMPPPKWSHIFCIEFFPPRGNTKE